MIASSVPLTTEKLAEALGKGVDLQTPAGKAFLHTVMQAIQKLQGQSNGKSSAQALADLLAKLDGKVLPDAAQLLPLLLGQSQAGGGELTAADLKQLQSLEQAAQKSDKAHEPADPTQLLQMILASLGVSQSASPTGAAGVAAESGNPAGDSAGGPTTTGAYADASPLKLLENLLTSTDQKTANPLSAFAADTSQELAHVKDASAFSSLLSTLPATAPGAPVQAPAAPSHAASAATTPSLPIQTPVGQPGWGQEVGANLVWMTDSKVHQAKLQMNPPDLGPLDVHISVHNDHTNVVFNAHHVATHEALQQELPRLRTMLVDNGFASVDVNVSQGQQGWSGNTGDGRNGQSGPRWTIAGIDGDTALDVGGSTAKVAVGHGLVDHYA